MKPSKDDLYQHLYNDWTNLSLLWEILNFGLSEDDVGIAGRTFVNVGFGDDEQDVLGLTNGNAGYTSNLKSDDQFE